GRHPARISLPAVPVSGGRGRGPALLGWRLYGQSSHLPAHLQLPVRRRGDRPHQPDRARRSPHERARHPQSHQRDQLQLVADAGAPRHPVRHRSHRRRARQERTLEEDADPFDRGAGRDVRPRRLEQAQPGLGLPDVPARRRPRTDGSLAERQLRQHRQPVDRRHPRPLPVSAATSPITPATTGARPMNYTATTPTMPSFSMTQLPKAVLRLLDRVPVAIPQLFFRFGMALVFWRSAQSKLASWDTTITLFREEYRVPVLPPELAAYLAATVELTPPVLL